MKKNNTITEKEIVKIEDIELTTKEIEICRTICSNTKDTWQKREAEEKYSDTVIGKIAEKAYKNYFNSHCQGKFAFYDDFRIDEFKQHNSIDFIFSNNVDQIEKAKKIILKEYERKKDENAFFLSSEFVKGLNKIGVFVGEIKSTRINEKYKKENKIDFEKIIKMDFLNYPFFIKRSSTIKNTEDYLKECKAKKNYLSDEEIINKEKNNLLQWHFRVFIEEKQENLFSCFLVSALDGQEFFNHPLKKPFNIKKMESKKSENPIYISYPIEHGISMEDFLNTKINNVSFENHKKSNFERIRYVLNEEQKMVVVKKNKL